MDLIEHIEKHLGNIEQGWKDDESDENFQIISFHNSPCEDFRTFMSLGLSEYILQRSSEKKMRMEVVFTAMTKNLTQQIVAFLFSVCEAIIHRKKAVCRGEVIPLDSSVIEQVGFHSVYCTSPQYFEDTFDIYEEVDPNIVIVWLVPIFRVEAKFIGDNGWESFEELLETKDPDLWLLDRAPII